MPQHLRRDGTINMQEDSPLTEATSDSRGASLLTSREPSPSDHSGRGTSRRSKITRKSHRKSRAGCVNCKSRRIKVRILRVGRNHSRHSSREARQIPEHVYNMSNMYWTWGKVGRHAQRANNMLSATRASHLVPTVNEGKFAANIPPIPRPPLPHQDLWIQESRVTFRYLKLNSHTTGQRRHVTHSQHGLLVWLVYKL